MPEDVQHPTEQRQQTLQTDHSKEATEQDVDSKTAQEITQPAPSLPQTQPGNMNSTPEVPNPTPTPPTLPHSNVPSPALGQTPATSPSPPAQTSQPGLGQGGGQASPPAQPTLPRPNLPRQPLVRRQYFAVSQPDSAARPWSGRRPGARRYRVEFAAPSRWSDASHSLSHQPRPHSLVLVKEAASPPAQPTLPRPNLPRQPIGQQPTPAQGQANPNAGSPENRATNPQATAPQQPTAAGQPPSSEGEQPDSQAKVIMVVDDSQTVRNIMALILHRAGYRSVRVASAMEALHTLTELTPDLIFLDITLPGMDGLDVCKIIKENPRTKQVPVVMLSGNNEVFDKVMGRLAGASDYITKPFEPESILKCIQSFCGQKNSLREGLWQGVR